MSISPTLFSRSFIIFSIIAALLLMLLPLPQWLQWYLPQWVPLILIYWVIALPHRLSIGSAWITGLLIDVLNGTSLGEHALALTVITFIAVKWHRQFRMFPLLQQMLVVCFLICLYLVLLFLIQGLQGYPMNNWIYWISIVTTTLCWPLAFFVLQGYQHRFKIN